MKKEEIQSIVDFAIQKEQEAIDFYTGLAESVSTEAVALELRNMADMERGHKKKLMNLDLDSAMTAPPPNVPDLKIANYTADAIVRPDMSWPDIVNIAMHRELVAANLYSDLAKTVPEGNVRTLFENLAAEELKHKHYLETVWDEEVMKNN